MFRDPGEVLPPVLTGGHVREQQLGALVAFKGREAHERDSLLDGHDHLHGLRAREVGVEVGAGQRHAADV
jgi:hypothetical protein